MKLGIFGGTFDPPHLGHLLVAAEAYQALSLDKLIFVPNYQNRLKTNRPQASPEDRRIMLFYMLNDFHSEGMSLTCSNVELESGAPCATIDTMEYFAKVYKKEKENLFFIMGADNIASLKNWIRTQDYKNVCQTALVQRGGDAIPISPDELAQLHEWHNLHFVKSPIRIEVSSTEIRKRIDEKKPFFHLLSPSVYAYIKKRNIYHV